MPRDFVTTLMEAKRRGRLMGRPLTTAETSGIAEGYAESASARLSRAKQLGLQERGLEQTGEYQTGILQLSKEQFEAQRAAAKESRKLAERQQWIDLGVGAAEIGVAGYGAWKAGLPGAKALASSVPISAGEFGTAISAPITGAAKAAGTGAAIVPPGLEAGGNVLAGSLATFLGTAGVALVASGLPSKAAKWAVEEGVDPVMEATNEALFGWMSDEGPSAYQRLAASGETARAVVGTDELKLYAYEHFHGAPGGAGQWLEQYWGPIEDILPTTEEYAALNKKLRWWSRPDWMEEHEGFTGTD